MPPTKWECRASDDKGAIKLKKDQHIQRHEKVKGVEGMLRWCTRVMEATEADKVEVQMLFKEKGEKWAPLMEVAMESDKGFVGFKGKFAKTYV